jgi:RNA polymerase sigma factor (sigma-70 family)
VDRAAVASALATLPDRYRVPLALRYYAEMSYDEIAERLGQTRQQVATGLFRAKQCLRRALARRRGGS